MYIQPSELTSEEYARVINVSDEDITPKTNTDTTIIPAIETLPSAEGCSRATSIGGRFFNEDEVWHTNVENPNVFANVSDDILQAAIRNAVFTMGSAIERYITLVTEKSEAEQCEKFQRFDCCGATFATSLLFKTAEENSFKLITATLGDSNFFAIFCSEKGEFTVKRLGVEHNGFDEVEIERVKRDGGAIIGSGRLKDAANNNSVGLGVCRGIGSRKSRYPGFSYEPSVVIYDVKCPASSQLTIVGVTDGITKFLNEKSMQILLSEHYKQQNSLSFADISQLLVKEALLCGSSDNCTVLAMREGLGVVSDGFGFSGARENVNEISLYAAREFWYFLQDAFAKYNIFLEFPEAIRHEDYAFLRFLTAEPEIKVAEQEATTTEVSDSELEEAEQEATTTEVLDSKLKEEEVLSKNSAVTCSCTVASVGIFKNGGSIADSKVQRKRKHDAEEAADNNAAIASPAEADGNTAKMVKR